jgi:hypothetical protein
MTLGIFLGISVLTVGVGRPIKCKSVSYQPISEVNAVNGTGSHGAVISVEIDRNTSDYALRDESVEVVCCLSATTILQAVLVSTELVAFGRINSPKPNPCSLNLDGITIYDAGLTKQAITQGNAVRHEVRQTNGTY